MCMGATLASARSAVVVAAWPNFLRLHADGLSDEALRIGVWLLVCGANDGRRIAVVLGELSHGPAGLAEGRNHIGGVPILAMSRFFLEFARVHTYIQ